MNSLIWGKLVVNAAINPLTALLGVPNGKLLHLHAARILMTNTAHEVAAVAAAMGMHLPFEDPVAQVEEVARKTATNRSSMLQDIQRDAPTEIDAICGAIIKTGIELGVPTPVNDTLYHLVKALVEKKN
jgi:2-dehydropantoate 2-reductase